MTKLEAGGITSPVVSVNCEYKHPTTYSDEIEIEVALTQYTGVKLSLSYVMRNADNGVIVAVASSSHCFIDEKGRPIAVKKHFPEFDEVLKKENKQELDANGGREKVSHCRRCLLVVNRIRIYCF